jgi:DNA-binding LytR/AlgR family response regulator
MSCGSLITKPTSDRLRILVVEDAVLVADDLAFTLEEWGWEVVGPVGNAGRALAILETAEVDCALLDVILGDEVSFAVAEKLAERGIPFVFVTGHGTLSVFPPEWQAVPRVPKPVDTQTLALVMAQAFHSMMPPDEDASTRKMTHLG